MLYRKGLDMGDFFTPLTTSMLCIAACLFIGQKALLAEMRREAKKKDEDKNKEDLKDDKVDLQDLPQC